MIVKRVNLVSEKGKEFEVEIYLNNRSIKSIERELKKEYPKLNFNTGIPYLVQGEMIVALIYLENSMHLVGSKHPLGTDWLDDNDIDFLKHSDKLITAFSECLIDLKPTVEPKKK